MWYLYLGFFCSVTTFLTVQFNCSFFPPFPFYPVSLTNISWLLWTDLGYKILHFMIPSLDLPISENTNRYKKKYMKGIMTSTKLMVYRVFDARLKALETVLISSTSIWSYIPSLNPFLSCIRRTGIQMESCYRIR